MTKKKETLISAIKRNIISFYKKYIRDFLFKKIYVKGKDEAPTFYSFSKKFIGLYVIFGFYSFIIFLSLNAPGNMFSSIFAFGNVFRFVNAIIAFFLTLSILISVDRVRIFLFEKYTVIKQVVIYSGMIAGYYLLFLTLLSELNYVSYLLALSMIWLFLLSSRFYMISRKISTRIESRLETHYSPSRYFLVLIAPFILLGFLVIVAWSYRFALVFLALNIFAPNDPSSGVAVYDTTMQLIMPVIYFSLVLTVLFIVFEYVFSKRRGETKRAGTFDNFTFSLIVFFIFFFQLFQMSIFLLLQEESIEAINITFGTAGGAIGFIFIFEFVVSTLFLFRIIQKLGGSLGWRVLFFKKDGLILLFLGCVLAQSLSRYALAEGVENQFLTNVGEFLLYDKVIISVLMILFLGITLLVYYLKPHETSMFLRLQKETVSEEEKSMDVVYKLLRNEYVRRGEEFPVEILEKELIKATRLSKSILYSLIHRLAKKDINIQLEEKEDEFKRKVLWINFISVVGRFDSKKVRDKKAREFLSKQFVESISKDKTERTKLIKNLQSGKETNQFIESLSSNYLKKTNESKKVKKQADISFKKDNLTRDIKEIIIDIIKEEYNYRIENPERYETFYIPISQISSQIQQETRITPGELYPVLENMNDLELRLIENQEEKEDKLIKFIPVSDDKMNYYLANFRPEEYKEIEIITTKNFIKALKTKNHKRNISKLKDPIPKRTQFQKDWAQEMSRLHHHHDLYEKYEIIPPKNPSKLMRIIETFINVHENKEKLKKQGL
ncbi:MAG: conserved membrane protein of unknown function [Promethearchaeota archaeon]|nr:MAG: conserved membrane protein of unknown function [Candidatus Lokiarchaeota archaeon]